MKCFFHADRIELDEIETRAFKSSIEYRFLVFEVASDMATDRDRAIKVISSSGRTYPVSPEDQFEDFNRVVRVMRRRRTRVKTH